MKVNQGVTMKRWLLAVLVGLGAFGIVGTATASASVDTNLAQAVKKFEWYAPKWVTIVGTHTTYSGNFSGTVCTSQWVSTNPNQVVYWAQYHIVKFASISTYTNWGNTVDLRDVIVYPQTC